MWKDGKRQRLEDVLNSVMAGLIEAALYKKAAREKEERARVRQQEIERQLEAARQVRRQERARVRRLERLWEATNEHQRLRAFVAQLHAAAGTVDPDSELGRWLSWADGQVGRLDPLAPIRAPRSTIRLYYLTSRDAVPRILQAGFTDRDPGYGEDKELPASVSLTDGFLAAAAVLPATVAVCAVAEGTARGTRRSVPSRVVPS